MSTGIAVPTATTPEVLDGAAWGDQAARVMSARDALGRSGWTAYGQVEVSGADVAAQLTATSRLLEKRGWVGDYTYDPDLIDRIRDASSVLDLLKAVAMWAVDEFGERRSDFTLEDAQNEIGYSNVRDVTKRCLQAVFTARHGSGDLDAWTARPERRFDEVQQLLAVTAEFALRYGPKAVVR